jgi:hypothetical protein
MTSAATTSAPALFGRLYWMMVGPFALAICAMRITQRLDGWIGPFDMIYLLLLGGMFLGRLIEYRGGQPMTAAGEPATAAHLRRYFVVLSILGLGIWVAAKLATNQPTHLLG